MRFRSLTLRYLTCICTKQNHFPRPVGCTLTSAAWYTSGLLGWKGALLALALAQLTHQNPFFLQSYFLCSWPLLWHGIILSPVQDFGFASVELHGVPVTSFLQPVQFPLNRSSPCQNIDSSRQSGNVHKPDESSLSPIINKNTK